MNPETIKNEWDIYHERANHEDMLNISRFNYFLSTNGFLSVAVGFVDDKAIKIVFALIIIVLDFLWFLWATKARKFIRALRDHGKGRVDEALWNQGIGEIVNKGKWFRDPLIIVGYYVPLLLLTGWIAILIYLILYFN